MVKKGKQRKGAVGGDVTNQRMVMSHGPMRPPPLITSFSKRFIARYVTISGASVSISFQSIADMLNMATTPTVCYQVFNIAVRLHRISVWGPVASTTVLTSTVSVDFGGINQGTVGPSARYSDTSMGTDLGPVVHAIPPANSQPWQWQNAANANLAATISCPVGGVVELEYTGVSNEIAGSSVCQQAPVAATTGRLYLRGPDGVALAASVFNTVGFNQN